MGVAREVEASFVPAVPHTAVVPRWLASKVATNKVPKPIGRGFSIGMTCMNTADQALATCDSFFLQTRRTLTPLLFFLISFFPFSLSSFLFFLMIVGNDA